ncbi:zf-TFIIB domain-containing protein [Archangium violaceum]|uniref:TFIIB-type zinc ribbon-containing protein n=1 Tax=Archangium violaceum TaxID=83451 RepID=UPI00193B72BE|nr:zf-TFIIB domain-containing protein [Archangium violaceum]QRK14126.1 zf-TFIIB domain-containing protein [Archangium violaceum]
MRTTLLGGLLRERCGSCQAVWLERSSLARLAGGATGEELVRRARGRAGQCKHCQAELVELASSCPACGEEAPHCPECGIGPLSVTPVLGVPVDVCTRCGGVGLDAGELEQLQRVVARARDAGPQAHDEEPDGLKQDLEMKPCAGCRRVLKPAHAFAWQDKTWCGSCAPSEASPVEVKLTPYDPDTDDTFLPSSLWDPYITENEQYFSKKKRTQQLESALVWFFSKVLGSRR